MPIVLLCGKCGAEILLSRALQQLSPTYERTATETAAFEPTSGLANADVQRSTRRLCKIVSILLATSQNELMRISPSSYSAEGLRNWGRSRLGLCSNRGSLEIRHSGDVSRDCIWRHCGAFVRRRCGGTWNHPGGRRIDSQLNNMQAAKQSLLKLPSFLLYWTLPYLQIHFHKPHRIELIFKSICRIYKVARHSANP